MVSTVADFLMIMSLIEDTVLLCFSFLEGHYVYKCAWNFKGSVRACVFGCVLSTLPFSAKSLPMPLWFYLLYELSLIHI